MKKIIALLLAVTFCTSSIYAQNNGVDSVPAPAGELADFQQRLKELRAKKAELEQKLKDLTAPDTRIVTVFKDGKKTTTVFKKNEATTSVAKLSTEKEKAAEKAAKELAKAEKEKAAAAEKAAKELAKAEKEKAAAAEKAAKELAQAEKERAVAAEKAAKELAAAEKEKALAAEKAARKLAKAEKKRKRQNRKASKRTEDIDINISTEVETTEAAEIEQPVEEQIVIKEDIDAQIEQLEKIQEQPKEIEVFEPTAPVVEEAATPAVEVNLAKQQTNGLSVEVVGMPNVANRGLRLTSAASLAVDDLLTATPPSNLSDEISTYDAKLKLIVGEMQALADNAALLPSALENFNTKLRDLEANLLKMSELDANSADAKYANFLQMNIDALQTFTGGADENSPTKMLMDSSEAKP